MSNRKLNRNGRGGKAGATLFRPVLLAVAGALFWAGVNEPATLDIPAAAVWLLTAATVGVLIRAALALGEPAVKLAAKFYLKSAREISARDLSARESARG